MKNSPELKKVLFIIIDIIIIAITLFEFAYIYQYKRYSENFNRKIASIIDEVLEKYPDISEQELIQVINSTGNGSNILEKYGIDLENDSVVFENDNLSILTRDTFGIAMKATYGVINGKEYFIYKDPKTDVGHLKKSHKGCCRVYIEDNELKCEDGLYGMASKEDTLLRTVYKDGTLIIDESFESIRRRVNDRIMETR